MTPNRSMSYLGSDVAAISIAQHMIPKWRGHVGVPVAQLMNLSTRPSMIILPGPVLSGFWRFLSIHATNSLERRPMMFACSPLGIMKSLQDYFVIAAKRRAVLRVCGFAGFVGSLKPATGPIIPPRGVQIGLSRPAGYCRRGSAMRGAAIVPV